MTVLNILRYSAMFGEIWGLGPIVPHFLLGSTVRKLAALLLELKPCHVEKFRESQLTDIGKVSWEIKKIITCAD